MISKDVSYREAQIMTGSLLQQAGGKLDPLQRKVYPISSDWSFLVLALLP
jgi:hypothetical protein